jgi:hypothetical protein
MIRRLFWMALGAVLGVSGYRKAAMVARAVSPVRARRRAAGRLARGARATAMFARDVREGMAIYRLAEGRRPPTLERPALERPALEIAPTLEGRPAVDRHGATDRNGATDRHGAADRNGAAERRRRRDGHSRIQDWAYVKAPAARDCPDEVKDGQ